MTPEEKQEIINAVISQLLSSGRDITGLDAAQSLDGISTFPAVLTTTNKGVTTKVLVSVPISLLTQAIQDVIDDAVDATTDAQSAAAGWAAAAHKAKVDITIINGNISNLQDADKSISTLTAYAECSTAANVSAKAVSVPYFALPTNGGCLHIKMEHANTAVSGVTLNINATGAKDLLYNGSSVSATNTWQDGEIIEVFYNGDYYQATNAQGGVANNVSFDNTQSGLSAETVQSAIEEVVKGHSVEHTSDYVNTGYIKTDGTLNTEHTSYRYTEPIQVFKGQVIEIETASSIPTTVSLISKCESDGTYISTLLANDDASGSGPKLFTYTVKEDCYVIFSVNNTYKDTYIYDRSGTKSLREDVSALNEGFETFKNVASVVSDVEIDLSLYEEEKVNITVDNGYKWYLGRNNYTGYLIPIFPNRNYVLVGKAGLEENYKSRYALLKNITSIEDGTTPAFVDSLNKYEKVEPNETKVVSTPSDANYMWFSRLIGGTDSLMQSVTLKSSLDDIQSDIESNAANVGALSEQVATMESELNGTVVVVSSDDFVNTGAIKDTGVIDATLTDYKYTDAIQVSKGDVIRMDIYATNRIGIVCACDENGTLGNVLKTGDYDVQQQVYTYTMLSDGYVRLCAFKVTTSYFKGVDITPQSVPSKVEEAIENIEELQTKVSVPNGVKIRLFPEYTPKLPCVCFQFDHVSDAACNGNRQIVELFESKGVKGGFGYVTGTIDGNNVVKEETWLKKYGEEYLEYHKRGWDIINHGLYSAYLGAANLEDESTANDVEMTDEEAKYYIFRSKYLLEKWGFTVNGWISYNSNIKSEFVPYVKMTHAYGATISTATSNTRSGSPCETVRYGMETRTLATLKSNLDTAIAANKICVFYCHTYEFGKTFKAADYEEFNLEKVEALLDYCIAKRDAGLVYLGSNDECFKYFYDKSLRSGSTRPTTDKYKGMMFFDTTIEKPIWYNGSKWVEEDGAKAGVKRRGTTSERPAATDIYESFEYYDTTLGKLIYWDGSTKWIDKNGYTAAPSKGTSQQRPTNILTLNDEGFQYYDTTLHLYILWNGEDWVNLDGSSLS